MKQILIDYLPIADKSDLAYKAISNKINLLNPLQPINSNDFLFSLSNLKSDNEPLLITILSHGHNRGITFGTFETLVTWCELCENVNMIKTNFPVILNLIAVCNSNSISPYKTSLGHKIDEIWVSTNSVHSIDKGLSASESPSFDFFISLLDDEEKILYKKIR
jgi:hypothetical protein